MIPMSFMDESRSEGLSAVSRGTVRDDPVSENHSFDIDEMIEREIRRTRIVINVALVILTVEVVLFTFAMWRLVA